MSGLEWGYCNDADVGAECVGVETAWSSAMPGWETLP